MREARAAAKVRHANVASVFHLGRSKGEYFYAMDFVEGETLESLIQRSGRPGIKLGLEIVSQVAAGLEAVHEQKLVHRDIKPTNIMVRLKDGGRVTAKIIDLEELMAPAIACLCIQAETKWHFGETASCRGTLAEAKSLAKKLSDVHGLVQALSVGGFIAYCEREATEVQRLASEMLDLSTRHNFAFFRSGAAILRGWAQSFRRHNARSLVDRGWRRSLAGERHGN